MWALNGLTNFLPYLGMPLLLLLPLALLFGWRRITLFAVVPLLAWLAILAAPGAFVATPRSPNGSAAAAPTLRVATANVLMDNDQLAALAADVLATAPDLVVFQELRYELAAVSPDLAREYPYQLTTEVPWVTLASKYPLLDQRVINIEQDDRGRDLLTATIEVAGQRVRVIAVHVMPPINAEALVMQKAQHRLLTQAAKDAEDPLLVIGDFNATTVSPTFAGFLYTTGLRVAAAGRALEPTYFPVGRIGLRIDHILLRGLDTRAEEVFALTGSDHRGVTVEVALRPASNRANSDNTVAR